VFDIPSQGDKPFEERIESLNKLFGPGGSYVSDIIHVVDQTMATSRQHVLDKLKEIEALGGEGLMLRKAAS
jgi:DNA ligase-1